MVIHLHHAPANRRARIQTPNTINDAKRGTAVVPQQVLQCIAQLANVSTDPKSIELTADVFRRTYNNIHLKRVKTRDRSSITLLAKMSIDPSIDRTHSWRTENMH